MVHSAFDPSMIGTNSMFTSSLNKPSSQEGLKPVEVRLRELASDTTFKCWEPGHAAWRSAMLEAGAEIERLRRELDAANSNHRSMALQLAELGARYQHAVSHPSFNDAIEAAAKVAEGPIYKDVYRGKEGHNWFHIKQSGHDSAYGNGRLDAASDIRSLKLPDYRGGKAG